MQNGGGKQRKQNTSHWRLRDSLAAALLFAASAAFVLWQNSRVAVLWDLGYLLDTSWRIALRQMPYRDFPLVHAPGTFLIQAALIRIFGRHYIVPVLYAALAGGLGTLLAWRIVLAILRRSGLNAWWLALLLTAPLVTLGVYAVYPHPIYDGDCALAILFALWLLGRTETARGAFTPFCAGIAAVLPLFIKQNIGLPFLAATAAGLLLLLIVRARRSAALPAPPRSKLLFLFAGMAIALASGALTLAATAGWQNYFYWTVSFASARRMPGFRPMLSVYSVPSLLWMLPALGAGLALCFTPVIARRRGKALACALMAAPLAWTILAVFTQDDADARVDALLALWPLWMIAALVAAVVAFRGGITLPTLLPFFILAAIHGTLLSQQLWGSTYALWPLLVILMATVLAQIPRTVAWATAATICLTLSVCGAWYAASLQRLNYINMPDAPLEHAHTPALRPMADRGPYLANFDELVAFTDREIPRSDALLLLPGEDPFYYATGRVPRFPVTLFDPATDPYSAAQLIEEAQRRNVRWVIVKRVLQSTENVMPQSEQAMQQIVKEFALARKLSGYDVYRRK